MEKILVSACLAGDVVRYDGQSKPLSDKWLERFSDKGLIYKYCPEVAAGMPIPRPSAQIVGGTGSDVLAGHAVVQDVTGADVTDYFIKGAERALSIVRKYNIQLALLKEKSPSCGTVYIYDGSFSTRLIEGAGVTTALLMDNNVKVFSESQILKFKSYIKQNFPKNYV